MWDEMADPFTTAVKTTDPAAAGQARRPAGDRDRPRGRLPDRGRSDAAPASLRTRLAAAVRGACSSCWRWSCSRSRCSSGQRSTAARRVDRAAGRPHPGRSILLRRSQSVLLIAWRSRWWSSLGLGWLLAGRLLRPLRTIIATARDISATNLSRRLRHWAAATTSSAELGETLNDLFARLEASFESQRHFVANASHELRTPLTAERTVLQVALADPDAERGRRCAPPARGAAPGRAAGAADRRAAHAGQQRARHRAARSRSTWRRSRRRSGSDR